MHQTPGVRCTTTECGFRVEAFHVRNWNYECTFLCLTQGCDSDIFDHDGIQQVGPTKDVDQVLNRPGWDVLSDALQGFDEVLARKF